VQYGADEINTSALPNFDEVMLQSAKLPVRHQQYVPQLITVDDIPPIPPMLGTDHKEEIPVVDLISPEMSPIDESDIDDEMEKADQAVLDDDIASIASDPFDEYDPYFDTFEVRPFVTSLILEPKAKTCWRECRRYRHDRHTDTANHISQEFSFNRIVSTV
jgi:hypothetical protein